MRIIIMKGITLKTKLLAIFFLLGILNRVNAQRPEDMANFPATPQSTALFKSIAAPVSYYTGQPEVTIPLYTISQDGVEVPVSISFNTSGIFVNEEATSLGLGLRLDWGGSIVRSPNGSPDEKGFFTSPYIINQLSQELPKNYSNRYSLVCYPYCDNPDSSNLLEERIRLYHEANKYNNPYDNTNQPQNSDFRPDDFHYTVLEKSGLFKFNQLDRKFVTFPLDDIKIEKFIVAQQLSKFEITKSDGVKITFGDGAVEKVSKSYGGASLSQSWFIKSIATVKNSVISFDYITNIYSNNSVTSSEMRIPYPVGGYPIGGVSDSDLIEEKLIKEIRFDQGKLKFIYVRDRIDINATDTRSSENAGQPAPRLDKIVLSNIDNGIIKTFQFHQSYFSANSGLANIYDKRLRLDSLSILDSDANRVEGYRFEYHTAASTPSKWSKARDHWGYYNGANNNTSLIPSAIVPTSHSEIQHGTSWSGYDNWHDYYTQTLKGNRFINSSFNKIFTIKKIKLPTGGEREYIFEDHQVPYFDLATQMKDISNDGFDIINKRFTVQGQSLLFSSPAPSTTNWNNTERIVYTDEFTIQGCDDTVLNEPNLYIRSDYVKPQISISQLNSWAYKIEIVLEKKTGSTFSTYSGGGGTTINRTDPNFNINPRMSKLAPLSDGTYRFSVKMTSPPASHMNTWVNSSGQPQVHGHFTVIGLTFRKKNFSNINVGGLRVKEIVDRDGTVEYRTQYDYTTDGTYSSGHVVNFPEYKERIITVQQRLIPDSEGNNHENYVGTRISADPVAPITQTQGSNVGYTNITKKVLWGNKFIKEEFVYKFATNIFSGYLRLYYQESEPKQWQSGKLLSHKKYNENELASEDIFDYYGLENETDKGFVEEINTGLITGGIYANSGFSQDIWDISIDRRSTNPFYYGANWWPNLYYFDNRSDVPYGTVFNFTVAHVSPLMRIPYFKYHTGFDKIKSKTTTNYFGSNTVTQVEKYYYDALPTSISLTLQETSDSQNVSTVTKFYYPKDLLSEPFMQEMVDAYRIGSAIKTERFKNGVKINEEKITYAKNTSTANILLPKNIFSAKFPNNLPMIESVGQLEKKLTYDLYSGKGKLLQYTTEAGVTISIIWGYNGTQPIAKIENATFLQVLAALSLTEEATGQLLEAPQILRSSLPNTMVTTYTYKPLVGVTSITDPKGMKTAYEYDTFGRLKAVYDSDGNLLSENEYKYRQN